MKTRSTTVWLCAVLFCACGISSLQALELETAKFAGFIQAGVIPPVEVDQVVYDSTTGGTTGAFSSTDLAATFGDAITTVGTGILDEFTLSIFNSASSSNTMPITGGDIAVEFFSGDENGIGPSLGNFSSSFTLASALNPGFFTTLTFAGLASLNIDLNTTSVVVTQQLSNIQGGSIRAGVVSAVPVAIGSSFAGIYIDASTVNGGAAGFYNITSGGVPVDFDLIYNVGVNNVPEPATAAILAVTSLLGFGFLRRR